MPYWNYHKVEKAINTAPWYLPYGYEEIYQKLEELNVDCHAFHEGVFKDNEGKILTEEGEKLTQVLNWMNMCMVLPGGTVRGREEYLNDLLMAHVISLGLRRIFEGKKPLHFFLEPTIAEALLSTFVSGIKPDAIQEVPVPARIFVPSLPFSTDGSPERLKEVMILGKPDIVDTRDAGSLFLVQMSVRLARWSEEYKDWRDEVLTEGYVSVRPGEYLEDTLKRYEGSEAYDDSSSQVRAMAFRLLINLLLYWRSQDADILRQLNPEYEKTRARMLKKTGKKRDKIKKALKSIPQNAYFLLGQKLEVIQKRKEQEIYVSDETKESEPTGRHVAYHMRRGHWRWQPCGTAKLERKLIFVESYWAGKDPPRDPLGFSVRS
jgi:hypothetical protein